MTKSTIYTSTLLVLMILGFGLTQVASSQTIEQSNLNVLNYSWYFDSIGGFHIVGEVQNQGDSILNPVVIAGTVYTPDGTAQTQSTPCRVYVNYMLPNQTAPFLMDFVSNDLSWTAQGIENVTFSIVKADSNSSYQYPNLAITSSALSTDSEGVYWVNGQVLNTGDKSATNVRVVATFFNSTNDVVAAGYSEVLTPNTLNPDREASFKVGAFDVNASDPTYAARRVESYTLLVQTEGPILSGSPPPSTPFPSQTTSSSQPSASPNSSPDGNSSNPGEPNYLPYVAIAAIVGVAVAGFVVYNRRKKSKKSTVQPAEVQPVGKRIRPRRRRRRDA